jgi:hypothetical protein
MITRHATNFPNIKHMLALHVQEVAQGTCTKIEPT